MSRPEHPHTVLAPWVHGMYSKGTALFMPFLWRVTRGCIGCRVGSTSRQRLRSTDWGQVLYIHVCLISVAKWGLMFVRGAEGVFLYRDGVLRLSSSPYNPSDLADIFSHLTNHCIQERSPNYENLFEVKLCIMYRRQMDWLLWPI